MRFIYNLDCFNDNNPWPLMEERPEGGYYPAEITLFPSYSHRTEKVTSVYILVSLNWATPGNVSCPVRHGTAHVFQIDKTADFDGVQDMLEAPEFLELIEQSYDGYSERELKGRSGLWGGWWDCPMEGPGPEEIQAYIDDNCPGREIVGFLEFFEDSLTYLPSPDTPGFNYCDLEGAMIDLNGQEYDLAHTETDVLFDKIVEAFDFAGVACSDYKEEIMAIRLALGLPGDDHE